MLAPEIPLNEAVRLENLNSLNILDTLAEERFDRVTRLARRLFDVPIAVVSLVDANRQWFKSCLGLDATETSRDVSFCGHTILGHTPFVIPDATQDKRFFDNPLVVGEPFIRFYAGCPLHYLENTKLGTLCIIDRVPRIFDDDDIASLIDLAQMAEQELTAIQLATLDELTKISNRRGFIRLARHSLAHCKHNRLSCALAFLDLNKFKFINDAFGHTEGDRALKVFADLLKQCFRDSDVFARLGGDEFVVLMTGTSVYSATNAINRLRQELMIYNHAANRGYDITFSEGIIPIQPGHDTSVEALLRKADALMYQCKLNR